MYVVALTPIEQPVTPEAAQALAAVLGNTAYEARSRLITSGPAIVDIRPDAESAELLAQQLQEAGFHTLSLDAQKSLAPQSWFPVRELRLESDGLHLRSRDQRELLLPWSCITASLRGVQFASETNTITTTERKFSPTKAILTSGLSMTSTSKKKVTTSSETRQLFLHIHAQHVPSACILEQETDFRGMGGQTEPSRVAALNGLVAQVRARCPQALVDDRLLNRIAQQQVLGPKAPPSILLASALIAAAQSATGDSPRSA